MVYLIELELPKNKPIFLSLTFIYGIGKKTSLKICKKLGFAKNFTSKMLLPHQTFKLTKEVKLLSKNISKSLRKSKSLSFKKLVSIKSVRGLRRSRGLPVRGQRTHSNARTARRKN